LREALLFPSDVFGPVEFRAFSRFAASFFSVMIFLGILGIFRHSNHKEQSLGG
jgi:hypothetical protein